MSPTPSTIIKHIIAVLNLSKRVPQAIIQARAIVTQVGTSSYFQLPVPPPDPDLPAITLIIDDLAAAEIAAEARTEGAVATRAVKYNTFKLTMQGLTAYVQRVADASPAEAEAIIESTGLKVKRVTPRTPRVFSVKNDPVSGVVRLLAAGAGNRASHEWQSSNTNVNWVSLPPTLQAKTTADGFTPGTRIYFRHRIVTKDGAGAWDNAISLIIT